MMHESESIVEDLRVSLTKLKVLINRLAAVAQAEPDLNVRQWLSHECDSLLEQFYQTEDTLAKLCADLAADLAGAGDRAA
ncbi:MAG: hypothetical protein D6694_09195 [Gammaproteobacteria bacterium]|nr:MAG: hypothetical protein D6694_09195 [Gammaproteobacteria bacterium]